MKKHCAVYVQIFKAYSISNLLQATCFSFDPDPQSQRAVPTPDNTALGPCLVLSTSLLTYVCISPSLLCTIGQYTLFLFVHVPVPFPLSRSLRSSTNPSPVVFSSHSPLSLSVSVSVVSLPDFLSFIPLRSCLFLLTLLLRICLSSPCL